MFLAVILKALFGIQVGSKMVPSDFECIVVGFMKMWTDLAFVDTRSYKPRESPGDSILLSRMLPISASKSKSNLVHHKGDQAATTFSG